MGQRFRRGTLEHLPFKGETRAVARTIEGFIPFVVADLALLMRTYQPVGGDRGLIHSNEKKRLLHPKLFENGRIVDLLRAANLLRVGGEFHFDAGGFLLTAASDPAAASDLTAASGSIGGWSGFDGGFRDLVFVFGAGAQPHQRRRRHNNPPTPQKLPTPDASNLLMDSKHI